LHLQTLEAVTLNAVVPPTHSVIAEGCEEIVGSATIVTAVALLVTVLHAVPDAAIST
jgi:hypothetical protein